MRTRIALALLLACAVAISVVSAVVLINRDSFEAPTPVDEPAPTGLEQFYSQSLDWEPCERADCADVSVPVDYEQPDGETTTVRVAVHSAGGERSLFVNPGGPGGSALSFASFMAAALGSDVRDLYDVVGVDPRGVGESSPVDCLDDAAFDEFVKVDPDPDTPSEVKAFRRAVTDLGRGCSDASGDLAAHVSTEEAARDMDIVRALLGREQMDWFGASYGTQLGATYAELFPDKVGRMVLDGAVDPSLDVVGSSLGQATGFQRAFDAFAVDCVTQSSCSLGDDVAEGTQRVADFLDQLDAQPLPTSDADRDLFEGHAIYGIAVTLYDRSTWDLLDQALGQALDGDGTSLMLLADFYFDRSKDGSYANNSSEVIYAVNCLDAGTDFTVREVKAVLPQFERTSPLFGRFLGWGVLTCADWPIEATHPQVDIRAAGAPPIVVIGTTRDPATPYEWAEALADQLESGVLISREGDGHTAYTSGNSCITEAVDSFLVDGTVPDDGLLCDEE